MRRSRWVGLLALLLLALPAWAQDPWDAETLDEALLKQSLEESRKRLGELKEEQDAPSREAVAARVQLLEELIRTLGERAALMPIKEIEDRRRAAQVALEALRREPVPDTTDIVAERDLQELDRRFQVADAERSAATKLYDGLVARRKSAEEELQKLTAREVEAKRELESAAEEGSDLGRYRQTTARLHLRVVGERQAFLKVALDRWALRLPMHQIELDLAKAKFDSAQTVLKKAQTDLASTRDEEARQARKRAEAALAAAEKEPDPIARFRARTRAQATLYRAERKSREGMQLKLAQDVQAEKDTLARLGEERQRLEKRLALRQDVSRRAAELLRTTMDRMRRSRQLLDRRALPELYRQVADNQGELVKVLDELWDLQVPLEENELFAKLLVSVPAERHEEARAAFRDELVRPRGILASLRDYQASLESIETAHGELAELYSARRDALDRQLLFLLSRIYWIRSDTPLNGTVLRGALSELARLARIYTGSELGRAVWESYQTASLQFIGGLVGLALLLVLALFFGPRLGRLDLAALEKQQPSRLLRWLRIVVASAFLPVVLLLVAALVKVIGLPDLVETPDNRLLVMLALIWFPRRFASLVLRSDGPAVRAGQLAPDVAARLRFSLRLLTGAALVFYAPYAALVAEPLTLVHVPRLLFTCFFAAMAFSLILLLGRNGPLISLWTERTGFFHRFWGMLGPLLSLALLGIVVMEVLGYRVGARHFMANAVQTLGAALLLAWFHSLLGVLVEKISAAVRRRTAREEGWQAARASSSAVEHQLSRVVSTLVLVLAVMLLLGFWGVDESVRGFLDGVQLTQVAGDTYLTAWNVLVALVWIGAAHFVVYNLSSLYEFLVFPLIGGSDRGGQYVLLALSRYVILLVAYSAALVSLHFSFSSIGWLLAAASVGLGFGLQEIVANFVSGLILLFERPIRVGDIISVGDTGGVVEKINIRATLVTNWDRQTIIVPNKNFITQNLTNWTRNDQIMRRRIPVGVAYGSDVEQVLKILHEVVAQHPLVVKDPKPRIWFDQFGESSLDFEVWIFCPVTEGKQVMSELRTRIYARFKEDGIEIPFPQRDLHLRSIDDDVEFK